MKSLLVILNVVFIYFFFCCSGVEGVKQSNEKVEEIIQQTPLQFAQHSSDTEEGFAVVELFTSEGCSSCPPADKLLHEIAQHSLENKQNVLVLSYHVDYWNRLGWKDPFSSPIFTQRQNWYAHIFGNQTIYTPQMIVNGKAEFVGSNRVQAFQTIEKSLQKTLRNPVHLTFEWKNQQRTEIVYHYKGQTKEHQLLVALVEKNLTSDIKRGENEGLKLTHYSVVRQLVQINPEASGTVAVTEIAIPQKDKFILIGFVQDLQNGEIICTDSLNF